MKGQTLKLREKNAAADAPPASQQITTMVTEPPETARQLITEACETEEAPFKKEAVQSNKSKILGIKPFEINSKDKLQPHKSVGFITKE